MAKLESGVEDMSDAADRLFHIRAALLQWLYEEALAGRHSPALPTAAVGTTRWPEPFPQRSELEAAATWLADKGYAAQTGRGRPARFRLMPAGESVARSPQGLLREEQSPQHTPTTSTTYNLTGRDINFANSSPNAQQSTPQQGDTATWTGSIAGIIGVVVATIGVVVALLAWSPWNSGTNQSPGQRSPETTTSSSRVPNPRGPSAAIPFTFSATRDLYSCSRPHIFQESIEELGPPPKDDTAWATWVRENNGIDSGVPDDAGVVTSRLLVTLRGRDARPVTVTGLRVEALNRKEGGIVGTSIKRACGSPTEGRYAEVNLDTIPPSVVDKSNAPAETSLLQPMRFPYRITDTDSEIFYIFAKTANYVEWKLLIEWSDGVDSGQTVIDDGGSPFTTSRPAPGTRYYSPSFKGPGWEPCFGPHC